MTKQAITKCPQCGSRVQSTDLTPPDKETVYACTSCEWCKVDSNSPIPIICIFCKKDLPRLMGPSHPEGAVCFQGSAPYGSRHDQDQQLVGLNYYEIFVCDDCWPIVRGSCAIGVKKIHATPPPNLYFSPKQVDSAFAESNAKKTYVHIDEMYDGEEG